jgi:hypothetical protein
VETVRVALIRYDGPDCKPRVGSGLLIDDLHVLTADHVANGTGHRVEFTGGDIRVTAVLRSGDPAVDLAVLTLRDPAGKLAKLQCGRVDRKKVDRLTDCSAVGFPRWKKNGDRRLAAQVHGWVPTAEGMDPSADAGFRHGYLTLVGDRLIPDAPVKDSDLTEQSGSQWGGMSGAGVTVSDVVIGVVRSHNLAAGSQSLTVTPLTALAQLPDPRRVQFWDALGVTDPSLLPVFPDPLGGTQGVAFNAQVLHSVLTAKQDRHLRVGGAITPRQMRHLREFHRVPATEQILAVWSWRSPLLIESRSLIFTDWGIRVRNGSKPLAFPYGNIHEYEFELQDYDRAPDGPDLLFLRIIRDGHIEESCGHKVCSCPYAVHKCLNEIKRNVQSRRN